MKLLALLGEWASRSSPRLGIVDSLLRTEGLGGSRGRLRTPDRILSGAFGRLGVDQPDGDLYRLHHRLVRLWAVVEHGDDTETGWMFGEVVAGATTPVRGEEAYQNHVAYCMLDAEGLLAVLVVDRQVDDS